MDEEQDELDESPSRSVPMNALIGPSLGILETETAEPPRPSSVEVMDLITDPIPDSFEGGSEAWGSVM